MLPKDSPHYSRCLELLPLVLDSQASTEDVDFFHQYAVNWPEVLDCYEKEKAFRETLKIKLGRFNAPDDLLSDIRKHINPQNIS
ncbi:hypothetical protein [Tunicatimonas pelagia]|uniref:hypothetical protein n=1 Tax=Tunicatimonas pelagia TaxID=931531 RepID=UPI002665D165|nr:hypothetical protein [Tunicatimonas pelagia]WKN44497.1 hypothetical protein P0M28_05905 [Tunicatimonas pelagia]